MNADILSKWKASWLSWVGYGLAVLIGLLGGLAVLLLVRAPIEWIAIGIVILVGLLGLIAARELRRPCLALLFFTLPLHLDIHLMHTPHHGGPGGLRITIGDLLLVVLLLLWLFETSQGHRFRTRSLLSLALPGTLLVIAGLGSSIFAQEPRFTAFQLFELIKGIILFLYMANRVRDEGDIKWVMAGIIGAVLVQGSLGLYQGITHTPLGLTALGERSRGWEYLLEDQTVVRPMGTLWHPNILAMYLGMVLPVIGSVLVVKTDRILKLFSGLALLTGLGAMISTLSRGAWIGAFLAAVVLTILSPTGNKSGRLSRVFIGMTFLLLFLIVINLASGGLVAKRVTADDRGAAGARIPLMLGALPIIEDHPIFGSGLNNYRFTIERYDPTGYLERFVGWRFVHNVFLLLAAEIGLLGLGAFLWLLAALAWRGLKFLRKPGGSLRAGVTAGLLAGGTYMVVHNMVDYGLIGDPQIFSTFWFLAGLLAAVTAPSDDSEDDCTIGPNRDKVDARRVRAERIS